MVGDVDGSRADLDEAWEMAQRGPMPLYQADILLTPFWFMPVMSPTARWEIFEVDYD